MFIHPGNVKLCITEEVPISVNPALSSVAGLVCSTLPML